MSLSLHLLADRYVFESSPTRHDLGALHVRFDELTRPGQTEARLDAAVRRREPRDRLLQYLDTRITIPQLPTTAAIDAILRRRIERYAGVSDPDLPEVFAPDASAAILGVYREAGSLRRALQVCHTALHEAWSDGAPRLTARHIQAAANAG